MQASDPRGISFDNGKAIAQRPERCKAEACVVPSPVLPARSPSPGETPTRPLCVFC